MSKSATKPTSNTEPRQIRIAPRPIAPVLSEEDWRAILRAKVELARESMAVSDPRRKERLEKAVDALRALLGALPIVDRDRFTREDSADLNGDKSAADSFRRKATP